MTAGMRLNTENRKLKRWEERYHNNNNHNSIIPNNNTTDPVLCHFTVHYAPLRNTQPFMQTKPKDERERQDSQNETARGLIRSQGRSEGRGQKVKRPKGEVSVTSKMPLDTDQGPNSPHCLKWTIDEDTITVTFGPVSEGPCPPPSISQISLSTMTPEEQVRGWVTING